MYYVSSFRELQLLSGIDDANTDASRLLLEWMLLHLSFMGKTRPMTWTSRKRQVKQLCNVIELDFVCLLSCVRHAAPCLYNINWLSVAFSIPIIIVLSLQNNNGKDKISGEQLKDLYKSFVAEYPIVSIEDPFDQDDWEHYAKMTAECGTQVQIVGDDLLVTNPKVIGNLTCSLCCWF